MLSERVHWKLFEEYLHVANPHIYTHDVCTCRSPAMLTVVTGFISHCLESDTPPVTSVVMTTWLFVCRQLYKTGAGLIAMEKYKIHSHIANRLQKVATF